MDASLGFTPNLLATHLPQRGPVQLVLSYASLWQNSSVHSTTSSAPLTSAEGATLIRRAVDEFWAIVKYRANVDPILHATVLAAQLAGNDLKKVQEATEEVDYDCKFPHLSSDMILGLFEYCCYKLALPPAASDAFLAAVESRLFVDGDTERVEVLGLDAAFDESVTALDVFEVLKGEYAFDAVQSLRLALGGRLLPGDEPETGPCVLQLHCALTVGSDGEVTLFLSAHPFSAAGALPLLYMLGRVLNASGKFPCRVQVVPPDPRSFLHRDATLPYRVADEAAEDLLLSKVTESALAGLPEYARENVEGLRKYLWNLACDVEDAINRLPPAPTLPALPLARSELNTSSGSATSSSGGSAPGTAPSSPGLSDPPELPESDVKFAGMTPPRSLHSAMVLTLNTHLERLDDLIKQVEAVPKDTKVVIPTWADSAPAWQLSLCRHFLAQRERRKQRHGDWWHTESLASAHFCNRFLVSFDLTTNGCVESVVSLNV